MLGLADSEYVRPSVHNTLPLLCRQQCSLRSDPLFLGLNETSSCVSYTQILRPFILRMINANKDLTNSASMGALKIQFFAKANICQLTLFQPHGNQKWITLNWTAHWKLKIANWTRVHKVQPPQWQSARLRRRCHRRCHLWQPGISCKEDSAHELSLNLGSKRPFAFLYLAYWDLK